MRLLHTTDLTVREIQRPTRYAILSHTWDNDEITFQDIEGPDPKEKPGYAKIAAACATAAADGFEYVWIDTCCIDKSSNTELSEAINSMYRWYQEAEVCYVHLADVPDREFTQSRWFTRGWTLQELIAPSSIIFFDKEWELIGTKSSLAGFIADQTRIPIQYLQGADLWTASIAQRMSWAAERETTRPEDMAYCLMGIFDVHMPIIYGEGNNAFIRLQREIVKTSDDLSIFAWQSKKENHGGLLATSPAPFKKSFNIVRLLDTDVYNGTVSIDNRGIHLKLRFAPQASSGNFGLAALNCAEIGNLQKPIAICLKAIDQTRPYFTRAQTNILFYATDPTWPEISLCVRQPHRITRTISKEAANQAAPLFYAAKNGHDSMVKKILSSGTGQVNWESPKGETQRCGQFKSQTGFSHLN